MQIENPGFFAEVKDIAEKYLHDRILLAKLEVSEKLAVVVSKIYILLPLVFLFLLIMMLITFLGGYYLSVWLGAYWAGFGIIILLYTGIFMFLIYLHNKKLRNIVANKVVQSIFQTN